MKIVFYFLFTVFYLSTSSINAYSQTLQQIADGLPYKSLDKFDGDTISYIEYNFTERPTESYKGMPIDNFVNLLDLPYMYFYSNYRGDSIKEITYVLFQENRYKTPDFKSICLQVTIRLEKALYSKDYYKFIKEDVYAKYPSRNYNIKEAHNHIKDFKISSAYVNKKSIDHIRHIRMLRKRPPGNDGVFYR